MEAALNITTVSRAAPSLRSNPPPDQWQDRQRQDQVASSFRGQKRGGASEVGGGIPSNKKPKVPYASMLGQSRKSRGHVLMLINHME